MKDILPDQLATGARVVFCGTAAGTASAMRGAYYAGPGNRFWPILAEIGLTPRLFAPHEFRLLPDLRIGLTDIAKKVHGPDAKHAREDFDVPAFIERVNAVAPGVIAFNGKRAASAFFGRSTGRIEYGLQEECLGSSRLFVLPSTSGAARRFWEKEHWFALARFLLEAS